MASVNINETKSFLKPFLIAGVIISSIYAFLEFIIRQNTEYPEAFLTLFIRANIIALLITLLVGLFELTFKDWLKKQVFLTLVLTRSISYTIICTFILAIVNGIWEIIDRGLSFKEGILDYLTDESYIVNILSILLALTLMIALGQINSLHRKGELLDFVLGRYHKPKEIQRIFCFIDLTGSTTIGENLGHYQFGLFLKDYYSDITEAIRKSQAEIYQYVGDEVILFWSYKKGIANNNIVNCFFMMKDIIENLKEKYIKNYGVYPEFKAGLHGGKVTVTWVGEIKKEIVFLGDVLNTTSRIQESCKRLSKEFLISGELLDQLENLDTIKATFVEESFLRGKERPVRLYSLERVS